jgi:hypothetical protein
LKPEFTVLVKKVYDELHHQMQQSQGQNLLSSPSRSQQKGEPGSFGSPSSGTYQEALLSRGVHPPDQPGQTRKEFKQSSRTNTPLVLNQSYQSSMVEEARPDRRCNFEDSKSKTNMKKSMNAHKLSNQRQSMSQVYQLKNQPNSDSQDASMKPEVNRNPQKEESKI